MNSADSRVGLSTHAMRHPLPCFTQGLTKIMATRSASLAVHQTYSYGYLGQVPAKNHDDSGEDTSFVESDSETGDEGSEPDDLGITHYPTSGNDSLLHLILGVQSYLSDTRGSVQSKQTSPLASLQYKMYMYLKRCTHDLSADPLYNNNS